MSSCERCWRDADGDPDRYHELLAERKYNPCSPEDQPWKSEFNRMPNEERRIIIHIADQLGKRQYFNAIRKIGELIQVCVRNQQKLIREID